MRRYLDIGRPFGRQLRSASIQVGLGWFAFDAWLDTGYPASRFEYTSTITLGPWDWTFDWRPIR